MTTHWIHKYSKGIYQIFAGNTLSAFQPLDFFHFYPMWYDLWIAQIDEALFKIDAYNKSHTEIAHLLQVPSSLRAILQKIMPSYRAFENKNTEQVKRVVEFLARMLLEVAPTDPFAESSSPIHTDADIQKILAGNYWQTGTPEAAKMLGRLLTSAGSLTHGLYNDLVTDFGWDAYGPYPLGTETLLVRHFPDLRVDAIWGDSFGAPIKELYIYGLYQNVNWKMAGIGCHTTVLSGDPITGLRHYAVVADGKTLNAVEIKALIVSLAEKAEATYRHIKTKNFEGLKEMVLLQEHYQFKKLFDAANMNWRPSEHITARVKNRPLLRGLVPHGAMVSSVEEFVEVFGIDVFAEEIFEIDLTPN